MIKIVESKRLYALYLLKERVEKEQREKESLNTIKPPIPITSTTSGSKEEIIDSGTENEMDVATYEDEDEVPAEISDTQNKSGAQIKGPQGQKKPPERIEWNCLQCEHLNISSTAQPCSKCGTPPLTVEAINEAISKEPLESSSSIKDIAILGNNDGTYLVSYTPISSGI